MIDNDENQRPLSTERVPTDAIISHYENKINRSIATKILKSSTTNETPFFTKEELAYLSKKAIDESPLTEVKVITTTPLITLKKGNTEIKVKNAAALVQKMEEKYPTPSSIKYTDDERKIDNHTLEDDELAQRIYPDRDKVEKVHTVNKNAYEIRESIIIHSISVVCSDDMVKTKNIDERVDKILQVASRFYEFVENRNRHN